MKSEKLYDKKKLINKAKKINLSKRYYKIKIFFMFCLINSKILIS